MRFILKIFYVSQNERFEIEHSMKMFDANVKTPKQISPKCLREFDGDLIYNMRANTLENSWEIVYASQDLVQEFQSLLKQEAFSYLYRHYEKAEGLYQIPMINSIGVDNFYEVQLIDTQYPTYDEKGIVANKTISKLFYSFTFSAKDFIPLKSGSYLPSFYNLYRKSNIIDELINTFEKKNYVNRFDNLPENEIINLSKNEI